MRNKINEYYKNNGLIKTVIWIANKSINKIKSKIIVFMTINSSKGNNKRKIKESNNRRLFIFASVPYFDIGGGQRSAQFANIFNKKGYDVFYFYATPTNESKIFNLEYPTIMHKYIKKVKIKELEEIIKENDIVIFELPIKDYISYLNIAKKRKAKIVYENIDNWETSLGKAFFNKDILKEFLSSATILTATAKKLKEQLEQYLNEFNLEKKEIIYSANAVNEKIFNPNINYKKPDDMIIGKKTFLYYGSLWGSWFDWNLIESLANENNNYQINLIGDYHNIMHIVKKMPNNIHFLGLKKQIELPSYLKYTDFAILPFKKDEIGNYVSPLKIFEYISMDTIILSTSLPDIEDYPNTFFGDSIEEWKKIITKNIIFDKEKKETFIRNNNWEYRCNEIIKKIDGGSNEKN